MVSGNLHHFGQARTFTKKNVKKIKLYRSGITATSESCLHLRSLVNISWCKQKLDFDEKELALTKTCASNGVTFLSVRKPYPKFGSCQKEKNVTKILESWCMILTKLHQMVTKDMKSISYFNSNNFVYIEKIETYFRIKIRRSTRSKEVLDSNGITLAY